MRDATNISTRRILEKLCLNLSLNSVFSFLASLIFAAAGTRWLLQQLYSYKWQRANASENRSMQKYLYIVYRVNEAIS